MSRLRSRVRSIWRLRATFRREERKRKEKRCLRFFIHTYTYTDEGGFLDCGNVGGSQILLQGGSRHVLGILFFHLPSGFRTDRCEKKGEEKERHTPIPQADSDGKRPGVPYLLFWAGLYRRIRTWKSGEAADGEVFCLGIFGLCAAFYGVCVYVRVCYGNAFGLGWTDGIWK